MNTEERNRITAEKLRELADDIEAGNCTVISSSLSEKTGTVETSGIQGDRAKQAYGPRTISVVVDYTKMA
jgi:hypothetical protein